MKTQILLIAIIFFLSSCSKEETQLIIKDTPVTIEAFKLNNLEMESHNGIIEHDKNNPFRIDLDLVDEGELRAYSFYLLINNDETKKYTLTYEMDIMTSEMSFSYTFPDLNGFSLTDGVYYNTSLSEELYFYGMVQDDTENMTKINFVVSLID